MRRAAFWCRVWLMEICHGFGIQVQKSPVFRRDGADIHSDVFVSVAQAILGGTARAQGLYETLNLAVSRHWCYWSETFLHIISHRQNTWRQLHSFCLIVVVVPCSQIAAGIQTDQRIRLAGKGIARVSGYGFGDHYVHVKIKVPK